MARQLCRGVHKDQSKVDEIKAKLSFEFQIKDLGKAKRIFGMKIFRNVDTRQLSLNQCKYVMKVHGGL